MHGSSPLQLAASSHLPRDTSLKTADGTSKNYTPDVQLIAGLHLLKQLQTYTSNSHMYTGVCVCTLTHRHTDTRTHRHTDTQTQAPLAACRTLSKVLQEAAPCSSGDSRSSAWCRIFLFSFFPNQRQFKLKSPEVPFKYILFFYV